MRLAFALEGWAFRSLLTDTLCFGSVFDSVVGVAEVFSGAISMLPPGL